MTRIAFYMMCAMITSGVLRPGKTLDHLVLRATARDVVVGLMSITLIKTRER